MNSSELENLHVSNDQHHTYIELNRPQFDLLKGGRNKRINLVNTEFNVAFIETLTKFKSLEKVYLFQESRNFIAKDILPNDKLDLFDFGEYKLEDL